MFITMTLHSEVDDRFTISAVETKNSGEFGSVYMQVDDGNFIWDNKESIKNLMEELNREEITSELVVNFLHNLWQNDIIISRELVSEIKEMLMMAKLLGWFNE